jgi:hypothetical protein
MRSIQLLTVYAAFLGAAVMAQTPPPSAKEVEATAETWGQGTKSKSSTVSTWRQTIQNEDYAAFQVRADLDLYQFVLTKDQLTRFIDGMKNFQAVSRQARSDENEAVGWLYRTEIKLKRLGEEAVDERLILNVERRKGKRPSLSLTFESWLLNFLGPDSVAGRSYKGITLTKNEAIALQRNLEAISAAIQQ